MDLAQVTLTQLRYAVAIADLGSFRAAAAACHVSQSGLSMQVQKLEELLGAVLFDRSKKPVLATPEGERALPQMRAVLREAERLGQVVAELDELSGPFRLAVIPSLSPTLVPLFLGELLAAYPRLELRVEELKTEEMIRRLERDALDVGLAATPLGVAGLRERRLGLERMVAYLPPGDPLLRQRTVTQAALAERALWVMPEGHCFRTQVLSYCGAGARRAARAEFESGSFQTLIHLVDEGLGATILPQLVADALPQARQKAQVRPLVAPIPVREIGLVTARAALRRRAVDALEAVLGAALSRVLGRAPRRSLVLDPLEEAG